jgi:hypothetical protein
MTWERYWRSPMGRHVCPNCQQESRFRWTAASWVRQLFMTGIGGVPGGLFFYFHFGGGWWIVGWVLGALLIGIPLDKIYDGRFRKLEKCETKDAA